jgi:hypothetical protein
VPGRGDRVGAGAEDSRPTVDESAQGQQDGRRVGAGAENSRPTADRSDSKTDLCGGSVRWICAGAGAGNSRPSTDLTADGSAHSLDGRSAQVPVQETAGRLRI